MTATNRLGGFPEPKRVYRDLFTKMVGKALRTSDLTPGPWPLSSGPPPTEAHVSIGVATATVKSGSGLQECAQLYNRNDGGTIQWLQLAQTSRRTIRLSARLGALLLSALSTTSVFHKTGD